MTTGERIKSRRKSLGINAESIATAIGVSRSTIYRYEKGDIEKLPTDHLFPIAKILHTSVAYLLGFIDDPDEIDKPAPTRGSRLDDEAQGIFTELSPTQKLEALNYLRYLAKNGGK